MGRVGLDAEFGFYQGGDVNYVGALVEDQRGFQGEDEGEVAFLANGFHRVVDALLDGCEQLLLEALEILSGSGVVNVCP